MFWIYGGNLQFGTANIPPCDGSSFAANQDVVLVTHNYRTNGKHAISEFGTNAQHLLT